jgi:hypothetical protein
MRMKLKELKEAYDKAVAKGVKTFFVEEHELVVGYAKYLIKYCESQGAIDNTEITLMPMTNIGGQR